VSYQQFVLIFCCSLSSPQGQWTAVLDRVRVALEAMLEYLASIMDVKGNFDARRCR